MAAWTFLTFIAPQTYSRKLARSLLSWQLAFSAFAGVGRCAEDDRATIAGNFLLYDQRLREAGRDGSATRIDSTTFFEFTGSLSVEGLNSSSHSWIVN